MIKIKNRFTDEVIASGKTLMDAINNCKKNLRGAYLQNADLRGADLSAYLQNADLRDVKINWMSHDLIAEILRQTSEDNVQKRCLTGLILISKDWCWDNFLKLDIPEKEWALNILKQYETEDNPMPFGGKL